MTEEGIAVHTRDMRFTLQPGETLLDGLERTGHDVEYQCRSGYCGMCRQTLIQGSVTYPEPPLAFVGPSDILPCCCRLIEPITIDCHRRTDLDSQRELFPPPDLLGE